MDGKLILHIGMAKTGSTSIQDALALNRDYLIKKDVYYAATNGKDKTMFARIFRKNPYTDNYLKITYKTNDRIREALDKSILRWEDLLEKNTCSNTIISCEGLTFLDHDEINTLKDFLLKYFDEKEIMVLIYVRDPISFVKSMVAWAVKTGESSMETAIYNHKNNNHFDYIYRYEKLFKNIIIRPFNKKSFYKGELMDDFFNTCEIDIKTTESMYDRKNESVGMYSAVILSGLNEKYPIFNEDGINKQRGMNHQLPFEKFLNIFVDAPDKNFDISLNLKKSDKKRFNKVIDHVNTYLDDKDKFEYVDNYSDAKNIPKSLSDIPNDFYIDLINEYNKFIEKLLKK